MSNLELAISIAIKAHAGQVDKAGQSYILHPLRVMLKFQAEEEMIAAVMHDVIEDSELSLEELSKHGFSEMVTEAIDSLTKRKGEEYESFIMRVSENTLATKIKIEDIKDNMDLTRLNEVAEKDLDRIKKYHRALRMLTNR
jgi:(p)ppGpp synthase/HD superfamily hydrolase